MRSALLLFLWLDVSNKVKSFTAVVQHSQTLRRWMTSRRTMGLRMQAESRRDLVPPWGESVEEGAPLLYMTFWEHQQALLANELGARRLELPADHELQTNEAKGARIASACYETDKFRKIRMTYFDAGKKVQVFNSLWYPRAEYEAPVLGVDLLCFGTHKVLAVIDCQPLLPKGTAEFRSHTDRSFGRIRAKYPSLCGRMSNRYYDSETFFSDAMLFGRFDEHDSITQDVLPAYKDYLGAYLTMMDNIQPSSSEADKARVVEQQRGYDQYSAEHDPAHGLFVSYFGPEWADSYVHDFLFSSSVKKEDAKAVTGAPRPASTKTKSNAHASATAVSPAQ